MATQVYVNSVTLTDAAEFNLFDKIGYAPVTSIAGTNTITATGSANLTYATGNHIFVVPAATNTGATTINVTPSGSSALGARNIYHNGAAVVPGTLRSGVPVLLYDDGTQYSIIGPFLGGTVPVSIYINDTSNANSTIGLTINQGASDDEILSFKSSDVAHGITTITETDTYGWIGKYSATAGGLWIQGIETGTVAGVVLEGTLGGTANSTHTASGHGVLMFIANGKTGTTKTSVDGAGNLLTVENNGSTQFIVTGQGDLYANAGTSTTAVTVYDEEDDVALVRALDLARSANGVMGAIQTKWDEFIEYNEQSLVNLGILGAPLSEGGLTNVTRLQQLHNGAIWQLAMQQKEEAEFVRAELEKLNNKLALLNDVKS